MVIVDIIILYIYEKKIICLQMILIFYSARKLTNTVLKKVYAKHDKQEQPFVKHFTKRVKHLKA